MRTKIKPGVRPTAAKQLVPTFKEFVTYILDQVKIGQNLDMHWTPAYLFCNPCQVNFTHLVKLETLERDSNAIIESAGLQSYLPNGKLSHENPNPKSHHHGQDRSMESYMNELSTEQVKELTKLYQPDFDIFGYNADISNSI